MEAKVYTSYLNSPIGYLKITGSSQAIHSITFAEAEEAAPAHSQIPASIAACEQQLTEYFSGTRKAFDLPLAPAFGTSFQRQVWAYLSTIPFGRTTSYLEVAKGVSGVKAIRAVGAANGKNPLCVVVPCHRVIGSDGSLTGYSGGLWRKEWLLQHEGVLKAQQQLKLF